MQSYLTVSLCKSARRAPGWSLPGQPSKPAVSTTRGRTPACVGHCHVLSVWHWTHILTPHLTDGKMRPGGSHNPFPQRPSLESNPFPSEGCDPRLVGWGREEISWSRGGIWGPLGPSWGQSAELPRGRSGSGGQGWGRAPGSREGKRGGPGRGGWKRGDGAGPGEGLGMGRRAEPGAWERGPSRPGSVLHPPRERPRDPFEAPVLGTRRAGPRPGGLHGCGAITQAQVWAQSGRGGGPAGKARAAALARAAPRGARACFAPRAAPARPPLRVWGRSGPAGAPRAPEFQTRGGGGGGGGREAAAAAPSPQLAAGPWVG